jgi:uncharacterized membrane protein YfcA
VISGVDAVILFGAGVVAGVVGSAGAITSLVSYPALLAIGVPPLRANVVNIVALVACWPGSALSSGPELRGRGRWLRPYLPLTAAGGAVGAILLRSTPPGVFTRVVPFLIVAGSLALLAQPHLAVRPGSHHPGHPGRLLIPTLLGVSIYNGYFGAGSGVMLLAVLLLVVDDRLPTANALKNMLIGAASLASAVALVAFGTVEWHAVVPLAAGLFLGSMLGPHVARRLPAPVLRTTVALIGIGFAVQLWLHAGW